MGQPAEDSIRHTGVAPHRPPNRLGMSITSMPQEPLEVILAASGRHCPTTTLGWVLPLLRQQ